MNDKNLRQRAEEILGKKSLNSTSNLTGAEIQKLIFELQTHQIELELQNEELLLAKEKVSTASEKYTELYDFAPLGYFSLTKTGRISELNIAGAKMLDQNRSKLIKKKFGTYVSDKTKPIFNLFLEKVVISEACEACEVTLETNGNIPMRIQLTGIISRDGELIHLTAVDITEQKKAAHKLQDEQSFRYSIESSMRSGIAIVDDEGRQTYVNPYFCNLLGWSEEELTGKTAPFVYWPTDQHQVIGKILRLTLANSAPQEGFELIFVRKDGVRLPVHITLSPFMRGKKRIGWLANIVDITERKKTEAALYDLNWRLESIIKGTHIGTWEWNVQTGETVINETWANIMGYSISELEPVSIKTWEDLAHPDDLKRSGDQLERHFTGELPYYDCECRMKHKDGHWVWVHDRGSVITRTGDGKPLMMFGTHSDISQDKQTEQEILLKTEELDKLNTTKDKFFSIIAHDLRSPFNSIVGFSNLLLDKIGEKNYEEIERYAQIIKRSSGRTLELLMNLMEWSRSQTGRMKFHPSNLDLVDLIDEVALLFLEISHQKEIIVQKQLPPHLTVYADMNLINTVLRNLISNAVKFSLPGGTILISAEELPDEIILSVSDHGVGISETEMGKLFLIGEDNSTVGTRNEIGTGLGLILCKEFVSKHDGRIWVESELGKGSTFFVSLPNLKRPKEENVRQQNSTVPAEKTRMGQFKILIVEDDEISERLLAMQVGIFGKEILEVKTGIEAIDICRRNPDINLILMDIQQPEMNGYEATRQIREFNKDVIIIAQTAYGFSGDKELSIESGCNDYIAKPFDIASLTSLIRKNLAKTL